MRALIATDGSDEAIAAARQGVALLGATDQVVAVCVVEPPAEASAGLESGFAGGMADPSQVAEAWSAVDAQAAEALDRTLSALPAAVAVETRVETGEPGGVLVRLAEELPVDVVVVGSRGRGAIKRALLGSVSTHVVHHAPCPVLVVRSGTS